MGTYRVRGWLGVLIGIWLGGCVLASSPPPEGTRATATPASVTRAPSPTVTATLPADEEPPLGATYEFKTDFSKHSVPYSEILSGGPPRDGIPAIDHPRFVTVEEADAWLKPREPVILFMLNGDVRVYPIQILIWHEIVNDEVGGVPVAITFCPLCNTAIAFDRRVDDLVLDFGTTGRLRYSNLIMYDRQTESWWQQATGEAIVGTLTGKRLRFLPAQMVAWEDVRREYPQARVLSRETGYSRPYGQNPYTGYDSVDNRPFLYAGPETPGRLPPMARVLTVDLNGDAVAYPYHELAKVRVVNDVVGGEPVVVFWQPGTASPLDTLMVAEGRDVGAAAAFSRRLEDRVLTFRWDGTAFVDDLTGTTWDITGRGVKGSLAGTHLTPVVTVNHFWFSWAAFRPDTRIYRAPEP